MTTPGRARADWHQRVSPFGSTLLTCLECLVGGVVAAVVVLFSLPTLVDLTRSFDLLSTTALAFVFVLLWLSLWAVIGTVHERIVADGR